LAGRDRAIWAGATFGHEEDQPHISGGERSRTLLYLLVFLVTLMITLAGGPTRQAAAAGGEYQWPVKPFDKAHPVRGSFGDPRTLFHAPPTEAGVLRGDGSFSFHFGVDISTPDGSKVYPVLSGTVSIVTRDWVAVDVGSGRSFQYWHIVPAVGKGDRATAGKTVLGVTMKGAGHVHFSELKNGRPINPLRDGGLSPYEDTTIPVVREITLRGSETGHDAVPNLVTGKLLMVVEAYDSPEMAVPAPWNNMPVTPARITWRLQRMTGKVVMRTHVARNVSVTIPEQERYWDYYARGTFQNMSVFANHYSYAQPGHFLFKLTRTPFDTTNLRDGVYDLVVTVSDIAGNSSSMTLRFTVDNGPEARS
jgi:hypothetical protein